MSFDPIGTHPIPREFHNVNGRFCGAIHNVDWANISVLSQVIHNVNERKTVQTNMISFVSHGAGILTIMEASAEHDCCSEAQRNARRAGTSYFVCTVFSFHKPIKSRLARGRLYLPITTYKSTAESATLRQLNSGYNTDWM